MIVFFSSHIEGPQAKLLDEEFTHCIKVLRKQIGDTIHLVDGKGAHYRGNIQSISKKECLIDILSTDKKESIDIRKAIGIAPTKNISRFEWFLEKATEIGITDIYPIIYKQSERKIIKPARAQKIVRSAFKQSLRYFEPTLHPLTNFDAFIKLDINYELKFIAHFEQDNPIIQQEIDHDKSTIVLIGPEGDFRQQEIDQATDLGFKKVNISENRLRTETAGVVALNYIV